MTVIRIAGEAEDLDRVEVDLRLRAETGGTPRWWSNGPGDRYDWHHHPYHKVLYCMDGSIAFHLRDGDVELVAGDRLDIHPLTEHAATVGDEGVTCVEASRKS
jgi:mannose-6-phosphate isomerase-like protein (cupin superfamily)